MDDPDMPIIYKIQIAAHGVSETAEQRERQLGERI